MTTKQLYLQVCPLRNLFQHPPVCPATSESTCYLLKQQLQKKHLTDITGFVNLLKSTYRYVKADPYVRPAWLDKQFNTIMTEERGFIVWKILVNPANVTCSNIVLVSLLLTLNMCHTFF